MDFFKTMETYFLGEKIEAWFFLLPVGIFLLILGITIFKAETGAYAWGTAVPSILFGLILAGTGIGVGLRTNNQVMELKESYEKSQTDFIAKELPRMEKVSRNFRITYYAFGVLALLGLILHYLGGENLGRGLGAALILGAGIGLIVDGVAERRAVPYIKALNSIQSTF